MPPVQIIRDRRTGSPSMGQAAQSFGQGMAALGEGIKTMQTGKTAIERQQEQKRRAGQKLVSVLSKATEEGWDLEQANQAIAQIPGQVSQEIQEEIRQQQLQSLINQQQQKNYFNYYKQQGLSDNEAMQAVKYKFGVASRPRGSSDDSTNKDQKFLKLWKEYNETGDPDVKRQYESMFKRNFPQQWEGVQQAKTDAQQTKQRGGRSLSDFIDQYPQDQDAGWFDDTISTENVKKGLDDYADFLMASGMSPEQAKQQTISEYGKLYSGQSGWKKYPRLNLGGVLDTNKTEQTIPSGQAKQPQAKQPQAKEQGQQKQTEVDMDKLYEYARKLDEQSLEELKAIINEGDPEKIKKAYKRLKDKYGNL